MDIGLRSTKIRTTRHETVVIPNNLVATGEVWNLTKESPTIILRVNVGISYDSDWKHAQRILMEVGTKHPAACDGKPPSHVRMTQFGESSIDLQLRLWIDDARKRPSVKSDILKEVKDRFDDEGIEIPFPYRTLVFKKDIEAEEEAKRALFEEKEAQVEKPDRAPAETEDLGPESTPKETGEPDEASKEPEAIPPEEDTNKGPGDARKKKKGRKKKTKTA